MPNRTRNNIIYIRLSDEENALFLKKQRASGLSKTNYFISMLKGSTVKVFYFSQAVNILYSELRKIGVNLNQIAYYSNSGFTRQAEQFIYDMTVSYGAVMLRLKQFLEKPLINACIVDVDTLPEVKSCHSEM